VTAITGFNCHDGVVIAADTEESYPGADNKAYANKLFPAKRPNSRLCVAGSGLGHLIDYANDRIVSALDSGVKTIPEFESFLKDTLDGLYGDKFTLYPVQSPADLQIQLLIGVQFSNEANPPIWTEPALFECQSNLVTAIGITKHSCILGVGELLKESGVQLAGWGLDTKLAEWASVYLIHQAKRRYVGVGGKTHTCTIRTDGTFSFNPGINLPEKEATLEAFARTCQLLMLSLDASVTDARSKDFFDAARNWLIDARRHLQKLEREKPKHATIEIRNREIDKLLRRAMSKGKTSKERLNKF
jgi:hypothetical protein